MTTGDWVGWSVSGIYRRRGRPRSGSKRESLLRQSTNPLKRAPVESPQRQGSETEGREGGKFVTSPDSTRFTLVLRPTGTEEDYRGTKYSVVRVIRNNGLTRLSIVNEITKSFKLYVSLVTPTTILRLELDRPGPTSDCKT